MREGAKPVPVAFRAFWALVALCAAARPALAQEQVKPYILLAVDTSGSMQDDTCGVNVDVDWSQECAGADVPCAECSAEGCGDGIANDSRLYKAKVGAALAVNAFGEVTFALARFHQEPANFACPRGGWTGGSSFCGSDPIGVDGDLGTIEWTSGDVLVGFAEDNQDEILDWMDFCDDYPGDGDCPATTCGSSCGGCGVVPVYCAEPPCPDGCDRELRGSLYTPNAGLLRTVYEYFTSVVAGSDPQWSCRPHVVVLLTDGYDSCPGDPATEAAALYGYDPSIPVYAVGFAGDAGLVDELDEVAGAGGTDTAIMVDESEELALALAGIVASSILVEVCNGEDDDCDGEVDEIFPVGEVCDNGEVVPCFAEGTYVCTADGSGVECTAGPGTPTPEVCDDIDNDCDGEIDEDACTLCVPEVCNCEDDDCDGEIDEDVAIVGLPCGSSVGACEPGAWTCPADACVPACDGGTDATDETCNGIDDDCDGITDSYSQPCYPFVSGCDISEDTCVGTCELGTETCFDGEWGACEGAVGPGTELCNGLDDDCDGLLDDDAECPGGEPCIEGVCATPCDPTEEFNCPPGYVCEVLDEQGYCVPDPCFGISCEEGEICVEMAGGKGASCVSLCEFVVCQEWEECRADRAACVASLAPEICCEDTTCTNPGVGCGGGYCCDPDAHECVDCACDMQECGEGACCREPGECVPCCTKACAPNEWCDGGECRVDRCDDRACDTGQACIDGECGPDPCLGRDCADGYLCIDGDCAYDPCRLFSCPDGTVCGCPGEGACHADEYTCYVPSLGEPGGGYPPIVTTGAGGCACDAGRGARGTAWLWLLAALALAAARRRRFR